MERTKSNLEKIVHSLKNPDQGTSAWEAREEWEDYDDEAQ